MKYKILKVCALLAVPAAVLGAFGCKHKVSSNEGYLLQDTNIYPEVQAAYEEESREAITRLLSYSSFPTSDGATRAAAELFAYACYNEEYIDKYVYFSDRTGSTDLGATGRSTVTNQDYKLIIYENDEHPGYKYHYTIKHVDEISGVISMFQSLFESGTQLRFVDDTDKLYRFNGRNAEYIEDDSLVEEVLTCEWTVNSSAWGTDDPPIVKREGEKLTLEEMEADVLNSARNGWENVMHGNINILADDIVESATINSTTADGHTVYTIVMDIDTEVANADEASMLMLHDANGSDDCEWIGPEEGGDGLKIIFQIWENGLFKLYGLGETWSGTTNGFSGTADSTLNVQYSYSSRDTDMTEKLAMLEEAKKTQE